MSLWRWIGVVTALIGLGVGLGGAPHTLAQGPTGILEICKQVAGAVPSGFFNYTVAGQSFAVPAGACSPPIVLPVGAVTVTEELRPEFQLTMVSTIPVDRLVSVDLGSSTATVTIAPGGIENQTVVIFSNGAAGVTPIAVPTLSEWGMIGLALGVVLILLRGQRRRSRHV